MKILLVAATREEVGALLESGVVKAVSGEQEIKSQALKTQTPPRTSYPAAQILITGVGMVATAYALGKHLATNSYDLAVNLGIAGSFDRSIALGEVVEITQDTFTELGAEDDQNFITLDTLGFGESTFTTHARLTDYLPKPTLRQVTAATVNTVHGSALSIAQLQQRIDLQLESMEGAAFFYACKQAAIPALQIRAVSNYVEKRNREAWKIGLAVKNLNTFAVNLLSVFG